MRVFIFSNLLPEFPYKSFNEDYFDTHVLSYWALAARGNKTLLRVNKHASHKMISYFA